MFFSNIDTENVQFYPGLPPITTKAKICAELLWPHSSMVMPIELMVTTTATVSLTINQNFTDSFLWEQLQKRFENPPDGCIRDIYDGCEYRKYVQCEFLSAHNKANVSLTLNTDGVDIYRSSKYSLWPVWLQINELPPTQRLI